MTATTPPSPLTPHAERMERLYRRQAWLFDWSRLPVLWGRKQLAEQVPEGARVIEVGCGTGWNLPLLKRAAGPSGEVLGIECAPAMVARARRRVGPGIRVLQTDWLADGVGMTADVVVFSYSLSMMPQWQPALERAWGLLPCGGQLAVLDFLDSPSRLVRRRMERYGVELGDPRPNWLRDHGRVLHHQRSRAWLGLWSYYLTITER